MSLIKRLQEPFPERGDLQRNLKYLIGVGVFVAAFLVFGANNFLGSLLSGYWAVIPWVLPTIVGTIAINKSKKRWKQKGAIPG